MPGPWKINIYENRKFDRTLTWKVDNVPVDLTGWSMRMQLRSEPHGRLMTEFNSADGSIILGGTAGTIRLLKPHSATSWPGWKFGVYDLVPTNPENEILEPLLAGSFRIIEAVTT